MIEPRKYTAEQDDGIDAPEVNIRERKWLVHTSCSRVYEQGHKTNNTPVFSEVIVVKSGSNNTAITLKLGTAEILIHNGADAAVIENTLRIVLDFLMNLTNNMQ